MDVLERRKAVREYKASHGCTKCGKIGNVREALLIRPDGTGIPLSRLLSTRTLSDEALWEEISRRIVICKRCFWAWPERRVFSRGRTGIKNRGKRAETEENHGRRVDQDAH